MRCIIYDKYFNDDVLKLHYQYYHFIKESNYFFRELFSPDNSSKRCDECKIEFKNSRLKKDHNFLVHHQQTGGSMNQQLPVNILRRGPIIYYSINFQQHKNFYDFYEEKIVDSYFDLVKERFALNETVEFKMQGYVEIKNYQRAETVELENFRVWLTNVFVGQYFNQFIRSEMKKDILKRVIVNGLTGSSWLFKRFSKWQVIITDKNTFKNVMAG